MAWAVTVPEYYRDGRPRTFTTGNRTDVDRWVENHPDVSVAEVACGYCDECGGFGPPHDGITSCESGSPASGGTHSHCTCDRCF